jgi:hypothetical protein
LTVIGPGTAVVVDRAAETGSTRNGGAGTELAVLETGDEGVGEDGSEEGCKPKVEEFICKHGDDDCLVSEGEFCSLSEILGKFQECEKGFVYVLCWCFNLDRQISEISNTPFLDLK